MDKRIREIIKIAREEGIQDAHVRVHDPHSRLCGTVNGKSVSLVVSLSKMAMNRRAPKVLRNNIRKAMRGDACEG